ncbi:hypothetical protein NC653_021183 [Populus alba x Populus x berolinensis]|uniref:Uncharacterized protein n=1 Tax=Populus alba x Populus x berolinensis TaxID=444605 RepID=A0AAD6MPP0_9ROSI|nr:hypothetical protein NC653_021183 [Populus alba x Populus x berolinensis]
MLCVETFNNSVFGISKLCSRSKHTPKERLFEEVDHHGQPASYSWAFTEVVLGYEIVNNESKHAVDVINTGGKKTIYSHLKKYFCGTRFTRLPFHKLGDVCVSGKASRFDTVFFFFFVSVLIKRYQLSSYFFIQ